MRIFFFFRAEIRNKLRNKSILFWRFFLFVISGSISSNKWICNIMFTFTVPICQFYSFHLMFQKLVCGGQKNSNNWNIFPLTLHEYTTTIAVLSILSHKLPIMCLHYFSSDSNNGFSANSDSMLLCRYGSQIILTLDLN